jgi:phage/plasmid primase-like uncharacterized protein
MGYWDATDEYLDLHGHGPICPWCGEEMFPQDDRSRFICFCNLGDGLNVVTSVQFRIRASKIPQADVSSDMSDEEKT